MIYDINRCAQCSGVRVKNSTLCEDCLVTLCHKEEERRLSMELMIDDLRKQIKQQNKVIDIVISQGFEKDQECIKLCRIIQECTDVPTLMVV